MKTPHACANLSFDVDFDNTLLKSEFVSTRWIGEKLFWVTVNH